MNDYGLILELRGAEELSEGWNGSNDVMEQAESRGSKVRGSFLTGI